MYAAEHLVEAGDVWRVFFEQEGDPLERGGETLVRLYPTRLLVRAFLDAAVTVRRPQAQRHADEPDLAAFPCVAEHQINLRQNLIDAVQGLPRRVLDLPCKTPELLELDPDILFRGLDEVGDHLLPLIGGDRGVNCEVRSLGLNDGVPDRPPGVKSFFSVDL